MAKKIRKIFTMVLAICVCSCMIVPQALAAEITSETTTEGGITTTVTTTTETVVDGDTTTVTITVESKKEGTNEDGSIVSGEETKVSTETTVSGATATTITSTEKTDGKEVTTNIVPSGDITVDIPEAGGKNTVTSGDPVGTTTVTGDVPKGEDDTEYDYTSSTVTQQGSVTVTTKNVTVSETVDTEKNDLDFIHTETEADANNDLFVYTDEYPTIIPTGKDDMPAATEGYEYVILGTGNSSQFYAGFLYTTPLTEDEEPAFIAPDGTKYYTQRGGKITASKYQIEGAYIDGEMVTTEKIGAIWGNVAQYILIDPETGELITTYCADASTYTQDYYSYNIENIEDGTYYSEEQAAMIRTVAKNGYWGVKDDPNTPEAEYGSLEAMKNMMREAVDEDGNRIFSDEEIELLTDGVAMTATQFSIWTFSNHMSGVEYLNAHYIKKDANNQGRGWSYAHLNNIPADKQDSVDLIFKLFDYMINCDPTELEGTTADTIINDDNFLSNASITVIGKAEDHANNKDTNDANDAYITNLTFALVVTPSEGNGDELVVTVVGSNGQTLAVGRIAGDAKEGETVLIPDAAGNYCFENLEIVEGEQSIKLNLSGVQNLSEGVYLYTSEVRTDEEGAEVSSQTMVGVANGSRGVNVTMEIKFDVSVDDAIVVTERVWRSEGDPVVEERPINPPVEPTTPPEEVYIPEEDVPETVLELDGEVIIDEEVPLADVPYTGDNSVLWLALSVAVMIGLAIMNLSNKKRTEN